MDDLRANLSTAKDDTARVNVFSDFDYSVSNPDSSFLYAQQGLKLAQSIRYKKGEINCKLSLALSAWAVGDYATAIKLGYAALDYGIAGFEPTVSVSTMKTDNKIAITVKDNGNGIPQKIVDKIFQPFFTTKPTGQGTGLGLSLSYDIVKAHGGEIKAETKEGEFTAFVIQLPLSA
jgi:light-regulated signal transduction histidine kinase (bacteriophytochrome)